MFLPRMNCLPRMRRSSSMESVSATEDNQPSGSADKMEEKENTPEKKKQLLTIRVRNECGLEITVGRRFYSPPPLPLESCEFADSASQKKKIEDGLIEDASQTGGL